MLKFCKELQLNRRKAKSRRKIRPQKYDRKVKRQTEKNGNGRTPIGRITDVQMAEYLEWPNALNVRIWAKKT